MKLGKYRVIAELGTGGMANVYLGLSEGASGFKKLVVIKSLREHLANSPEFCQMLLDEARLAARLSHPNVVQTNEVGSYAGRPALVMEYLEGQPLSAVLSRSRNGERMPLSMHLKIIAEALVGLDYAHELTDYDGSPLNLVHRDVSPSNVFVTFDGNVKVLDFGIAKAATSSHNTNTGELKGKIAYMAPEQMLGEKIIDRRADLFAVGVMIWEAVAGRRMWEGCNEVTIMRRVLNDQVPKLTEVNPDAPEGLVRICERALAVDRSKRYETASEFERDVDAALAQLADTVKMKDIGKYVASMFADVRSRTRKVIEDQTRVVEAGATDSSLEPVALAELLDRSGTGARAGSGTLQSPLTPARRRMWIWPAVVIAAAAGTVLLMKHGPFAAAKAPAAGDVAALAGSADPPGRGTAEDPTAPKAPDLIDVSIQASPSVARIFWDDESLPANPVTKKLPKDASQHTVRVEAPGFVSREVQVTLDQSSSVSLELQRVPPSAQVVPPRGNPGRGGPHLVASAATAPQASTAPPPPTSAPKGNCDPPFYLDNQGIRHPKAWCM